MNPDERLAAVVTVLESAGLTCLVMGGHAVRFYGLHRYTSDFDLHLSADGWDDLAERLNRSPLATAGPLPEGPSWRPHAFRRFQIGRFDDGREEWLEFWRENHLLDAFPALHARREEGEYGGRVLPFLGLADLIRSKETERESDWDDVLVLEEFLDACGPPGTDFWHGPAARPDPATPVLGDDPVAETAPETVTSRHVVLPHDAGTAAPDASNLARRRPPRPPSTGTQLRRNVPALAHRVTTWSPRPCRAAAVSLRGPKLWPSGATPRIMIPAPPRILDYEPG